MVGLTSFSGCSTVCPIMLGRIGRAAGQCHSQPSLFSKLLCHSLGMRQFAFVLRLRKCLAGSKQVAAFQQQEIEFIYRIVELSIIYPKPCWSTGVCENSSSFCSGRNEMAIIASGMRRRRRQWPTCDTCVGS